MPSTSGQFSDEAGLSHSCLTGDEHHVSLPEPRALEYVVQEDQCVAATDELRGSHPARHNTNLLIAHHLIVVPTAAAGIGRVTSDLAPITSDRGPGVSDPA